MNIVVLAGGLSTERNVSLTTGAMVQNALVKRGHHAILADVFLGYPLSGSIEEEFKKATKASEVKKISELVPDIEKIKLQRGGASDEFFGENIIDLCRYADIVFMALHGENGENGRIQAAFDLLGIKYTGSGYLACAVSIHKNLTKQIFSSCGVRTPRGKMVKKGEAASFSQFECDALVIKPCSGGSSIGVYIVKNEEEFQKALKEAFLLEEEVLIEEYVSGREFSVGIIGSTALPAIEIIPLQGFYDYKNKYQEDLTKEICPADITEEEESLLGSEALKAFNALGLEGYARLDFILTKNKEAVCLEANSLPGMTPTSLLPQEAAAAGMSYGELCEEIIRLGIEK